MEQENAKAIQILGKVVVKLQELVKELEAPAPALAPAPAAVPVGAPAVAPKPASNGFFGNIFGSSEPKPAAGGKASKKGKKAKKGGASSSSMVYNTSDLMKGLPNSPPDPTKDPQVTGMQFMPQPFSSGNTYVLSGAVKDVLEANDWNTVNPVVGGGKKKARKPRNPKH